MSSSESIVSVDILLQPIAATSPAGESLRYEGTYDLIQEARREEMELPQGVWQREPKKADWPAVAALCIDALSHRTKDLQIAVWLAEAWVRLDGLAGLSRGLHLVQNLHEEFWETMFPPADDLEYRTGQLTWLNEKLAMQVKFIEIAIPVDTTLMPEVTFARWESAQHSDQAARRQSKTPDNNKSELVLLQRSMASTPDGFYRELVDRLHEAKLARAELDALLDRLYGSQNPGLRQLNEVLESIASVVTPLVKPTNTALTLESMIQEDEGAMVEVPAVSSAVSTAIRNRNDAYRCLAEVAEYLSRTEPHSPVPYLIRRAIAWGSMDLDELLPELLNHEGALKDVVSLLQINSPKR